MGSDRRRVGFLIFGVVDAEVGEDVERVPPVAGLAQVTRERERPFVNLYDNADGSNCIGSCNGFKGIA